MTLNHNGSIKAEYEYTDYGRRENVYDIYNYQDEAIGYNGEYHESSELIHLRARYYDPSDYSFISEDSYRGNLNDPSSRNRYLYGRSNPKKYIDPSGHYLNVNYQMTDSGSGRGSKVPKPSSTIIKPSQVNTPAIVNPYYYHSQVSSTPQRYTDSGSEQRAYQNTRSYIQNRQEEKYSYQKGGNTSVVTAAEAKKEAVQVYKDIRQTTKEVIEPQTKKYTTTDAKTNNILLNLKNEASKFIGLFNKTSGSLEDRAKQACKSTLSWVDDNLQLIAAVGLLLATVGIIVASGGIATAALLPTLAEIGGTIASTSGTMAMVGSGIAITSGSLQVITGLFEHSLDGNKLSNAEGKSRYEAGAMNALLGGLTFFGGSFVKDIGQAILLGHYFNSTTNVSEPINNIRPTPRESELEMYRIENISIEDQQKTYLNGKLTNNNAKLKGSSIPDATVIKVNTAYEVKNYDLKYSSQLINNICTQIKQRVNNLPFKMKQHIYIDVRGQTYNLKDLEIIRKKIIEKNDADIEIIVSFITNEGVK